MRFDLLFDDLEAQLESQLAAEGAQQRGEEERLRAARTSLRERLASVAGRAGAGIRLRLIDGSAIDVSPVTVGRDWLAADLPGGGGCVVPIAAIASVALSSAQVMASRERMPEQAPPAQGALTAKIGIGVVLRDLARRRVPLDVLSRAEPAPVHGTIDRVGADHLDLAVHERGAARRASSVLEHRIIALPAVSLLRL
ncbi:hypothetical protein [Gryllotalpicola daejeonensis]|uniref:hypothetical protein n=1 Tax=Gryllotalpicola daejeonensis TaxID=993087 RepID=UPI0031CDAF8F